MDSVIALTFRCHVLTSIYFGHTAGGRLTIKTRTASRRSGGKEDVIFRTGLHLISLVLYALAWCALLGLDIVIDLRFHALASLRRPPVFDTHDLISHVFTSALGWHGF